MGVGRRGGGGGFERKKIGKEGVREEYEENGSEGDCEKKGLKHTERTKRKEEEGRGTGEDEEREGIRENNEGNGGKGDNV